MPAKTRVGLFALALTAAVLIVIARFPAGRLAAWFLPDTDVLQIGGISGSLWAGEGYGLHWRGRPLGILRWHFAPAPGPAWRLELEGAGLSAAARVRPELNGWALDDLTGVWPIERLEHGIDKVALGGEVHAAISHLALSENRLAALDGRLEWRAARLEAPVQLELGTVTVDLATVETGHIAVNAASSGPAEVTLRGTGKIELGTYTLTVHLRAVSPSAGAWLAALGEPQADGTVRVELAGKL